jgi:elongation factor Ts
MVKDLRERTGAGMMECKNALVEANGDMEAAIEHLRKTGLAQADKKASRTAAEGVIALAVSDDNRRAVLVEINCETDFVAKDDNFISFAEAVASNALAQGGSDTEALMSTEIDGNTVEEARQALVTKIGENVQVRRMVGRETDGVLGAYVHGGKIGVLVELEGGDEPLARDIAMHVAAMNPEFVSADDVPADVVAKEQEILAAQAQEEAKGGSKPPEIIEKMVSGRLRKHLSSITLLGQPFVKDSDLTIEQLLSQAGATVAGFERLVVGEGIEKEESDFAAEVLQQASRG